MTENGNFFNCGLSVEHKEAKSHEFFSQVLREAPCIVVLKREKSGKINRITVIDLNKQGLIDVESTKVLLKESVEIYRTLLREDRAFIDAYKRKVEMRRMIQNGQMPEGMGYNNPAHRAQLEALAEQYGRAAEQQHEVVRQEDLARKRQLDMEREY